MRATFPTEPVNARFRILIDIFGGRVLYSGSVPTGEEEDALILVHAVFGVVQGEEFDERKTTRGTYSRESRKPTRKTCVNVATS